jgi:hypothetical protein
MLAAVGEFQEILGQCCCAGNASVMTSQQTEPVLIGKGRIAMGQTQI